MDAVKYIKEINRAKKNMEEWESLRIAENENPEKAVEIVEQWAKDHPRKTYRDDFFEKFPNAKKGNEFNPHANWCTLQGKYQCDMVKNKQCERECIMFAQSCCPMWDKEIE